MFVYSYVLHSVLFYGCPLNIWNIWIVFGVQKLIPIKDVNICFDCCQPPFKREIPANSSTKSNGVLIYSASSLSNAGHGNPLLLAELVILNVIVFLKCSRKWNTFKTRWNARTCIRGNGSFGGQQLQEICKLTDTDLRNINNHRQTVKKEENSQR